MDRVSVPLLQQMKRDKQKIVGVVAWDFQMARIADRAGVEIVSVGDSVGMNLWGRTSALAVTLDEMVVVAGAVRRGVSRALVSCDFPFGPLQKGTRDALGAAVRLVQEAGVDMVKLDGAADFPRSVERISGAGIPVFAQLGVTPQTARRFGVDDATLSSTSILATTPMTDALVADAKRLEAAGAVLLDFTNSGPIAGPAVAAAVAIPVLGGMGGGPWLDGRIRMAHAAIGYAAVGLDDPPDTYANVARVAHDALRAYADDVRAGRQIRGGIPPA